jgi:hypothetical protein
MQRPRAAYARGFNSPGVRTTRGGTGEGTLTTGAGCVFTGAERDSWPLKRTRFRRRRLPCMQPQRRLWPPSLVWPRGSWVVSGVLAGRGTHRGGPWAVSAHANSTEMVVCTRSAQRWLPALCSAGMPGAWKRRHGMSPCPILPSFPLPIRGALAALRAGPLGHCIVPSAPGHDAVHAMHARGQPVEGLGRGGSRGVGACARNARARGGGADVAAATRMSPHCMSCLRCSAAHVRLWALFAA